MLLHTLIEHLCATDRQLEEVLINSLKFKPQSKIKFDFTVIINNKLEFLYISLMGLRFLGLKAAIIEGENREKIKFPLDNFEEIEKKAKMILNMGNIDNNYYIGLLNIKGYYFEYLLSPIYTAIGTIEAVMCTFTDTSDGKLVETFFCNQILQVNQLKAREENDIRKQEILERYLTENRKLNQLIDLCPLGIVLYDRQGNVIELNRAHSVRIAKLNREEFLGKPGAKLLDALGLRWENSPCNRALSGIETLDCYSKSKYGRHYLVNAIPLKDYQDAIIGAMTIIHDITEYEKLKEEMTKLDRLNLVGEMAAGVAHEIRNPMTVIKGYLQFLSKSVPENIMEQFALVLRELEQIEGIITDFLSLAGNKRVVNKEQNLNSIIKEIAPLVLTEARKHSIELKIKLDEKLPILILNEKEIKQLILNLARNAIEAMEQGGILYIESLFNNEKVYLCFEDTGCGICIENQEKVFDPFFTTKENGTGLGLAVCAGIVRRNSGIINVQSEQGKGTRVTVSF